MTIEQLMEAEKVELKKNIDRLQAVFDSEEYKTFHGGAQRRILKQLNVMHEYYDVLRSRIGEEEFY